MPTAEQLALRADFDRLINMSAEEMSAWYASPDSDFASLSPIIAAKLKQKSGKTLGKQALVLKGKPTWEDGDYEAARTILKPLKLQLSRQVSYTREDGTPTPFAVALRNRGHDPLKDAAAPAVAPIPVTPPPATLVVAEGLSVGQMEQRISKALDDLFRQMFGGEYPDGIDRPWTEYGEVYPLEQQFIFRWDGESFRMGYTVSGTTFTLLPETMERVRREWIPDTVAGTDAAPSGVLTEVAEAEGDAGPVWYGYMIRAGEAKNLASNGKKRIYTAEALRDAVAEGLFDNVPGYQRTDAEHSKESGTSVAGTWGKAMWDAAANAVKNAFQWKKEKYPSAVHKLIKVALAEGKTDHVPGFSITGDVIVDKASPNIIRRIAEIRSCDPISTPSAGGTVIDITESHQEKTPMKITVTEALAKRGLTVPAPLKAQYDKVRVTEAECADWMLAQLKEKKAKLFEKRPDLEAKLSGDEPLLVAMFEDLMEAEGVAPAKTEDTPAPGDPNKPEPVAEGLKGIEEQLAKVREAQIVGNRYMVDGILAASGLDATGRDMVKALVDPVIADVTPERVQESVRTVKDQIAKIRNVNAPHISAGMDQKDKVGQAWADLFFRNVNSSTERAQISESYGGEMKLSPSPRGGVLSVRQLAEMELGRSVNWMDRQDVQEAMDSVVASAHLVNGMNLRLAYSYNLKPEWQSYRNICNIVPLSDMKTKNTLIHGALSGWGVKADGAAYSSLTDAGAIKESYTPEEYGGIQDVSWKHFVNDDTGYIMGRPDAIAKAALIAINNFVWGTLVRGNPVLSDTKNVFHADHNNVIALPLDEVGLTAAMEKMQLQLAPGGTFAAIATPKFIATSLSVAQRKGLYGLIEPGFGQANQTSAFMQRLGFEGIVDPLTTDYNDWYMFSDDPAQIIELGFFGGQQTPVITVANDPGIGRRFTHNEIQFKGNHEYSGAWVDYRGAVRAVVAG